MDNRRFELLSGTVTPTVWKKHGKNFRKAERLFEKTYNIFCVCG